MNANEFKTKEKQIFTKIKKITAMDTPTPCPPCLALLITALAFICLLIY